MILVKYSEIALKGGNRAKFEERLVQNISKQTGISASQIKRIDGRIVVFGEFDKEAVKESLSRVFGVHGFAFAQSVASETEHITEAVKKLLSSVDAPVQTFRISTNRANKSFSLSSRELNERIGAQVGEWRPEWSVDLEQPDVTFFVEIREGGVFVHTNFDEHKGPGGLPIGTGGKTLALLSGGIDSPVAVWRMMRRGVHVDAVYFHSPPFVGEKTKQKLVDLMRALKAWSPNTLTLYVVNFSDVQVELKKAPEQYWTLLFRRSMHRIAEKLASQYKHDALVTGDNLGQVASQTIENIGAIDSAASTWVARPLLAAEKQETISQAKKIGTYEISVEPFEDCCTVFTPSRPATSATAAELERVESDIAQLEELEAEAIYSTEQLFIDRR